MADFPQTTLPDQWCQVVPRPQCLLPDQQATIKQSFKYRANWQRATVIKLISRTTRMNENPARVTFNEHLWRMKVRTLDYRHQVLVRLGIVDRPNRPFLAGRIGVQVAQLRRRAAWNKIGLHDTRIPVGIPQLPRPN